MLLVSWAFVLLFLPLGSSLTMVRELQGHNNPTSHRSDTQKLYWFLSWQWSNPLTHLLQDFTVIVTVNVLFYGVLCPWDFCCIKLCFRVSLKTKLSYVLCSLFTHKSPLGDLITNNKNMAHHVTWFFLKGPSFSKCFLWAVYLMDLWDKLFNLFPLVCCYQTCTLCPIISVLEADSLSWGPASCSYFWDVNLKQ